MLRRRAQALGLSVLSGRKAVVTGFCCALLTACRLHSARAFQLFNPCFRSRLQDQALRSMMNAAADAASAVKIAASLRSSASDDRSRMVCSSSSSPSASSPPPNDTYPRWKLFQSHLEGIDIHSNPSAVTSIKLTEYIDLAISNQRARQTATTRPASAATVLPHATSRRSSEGAAHQEEDEGVATDDDEEDWLAVSADLAASLGIDPVTADEAEHRRVFHLYLPVYFWLMRLIQRFYPRISSTSSIPSTSVGETNSGNASHGSHHSALVVGISAPQGCGKTTLVEEMRRMLEKAGHRCTVLSIDDFYLTGRQQDELAERHPTNPLLQVRGNPGTHDLALGIDTIRALKYGGRASGERDVDTQGSHPSSRSTAGISYATTPPETTVAATSSADLMKGQDAQGRSRKEGSVVRVPRYDKSARAGKGDRAPREEWGEVSSTEAPEIVLLEGWMLGFEALERGSPILTEVATEEGGVDTAESLEVVNDFLTNYKELHDEIDSWLVLKTADPEMVFEWRAEAEHRMRAAGRPGMSDDQVRDFCSRYMPAYRAYLPGLYRRFADGGGVENNLAADTRDDEEERRELLLKEKPQRVGNPLVIEVGRDRNPII